MESGLITPLALIRTGAAMGVTSPSPIDRTVDAKVGAVTNSAKLMRFCHFIS